MIYQRPIFGGLAALFCFGLGFFALIQNRKAPLNQSFALYNFCLALWNLSDFIILIPDPAVGLWYIRVMGLWGCLLIPFYMQFLFILFDLYEKSSYQKLTRFYFGLGTIFYLLHLTPLIIKKVIYVQYPKNNYLEIAGPLYPVFGIFLISGLLISIILIIKKRSHLRGPKRIRSNFALFASFLGFMAISFYFLSFIRIDLPSIYYTLEVSVSFTFAYAIFKHELIPAKTVVRRLFLIFGIYSVLVFILTPITYVFYKHLSSNAGVPLSSFIYYSSVIGLLFTMGPILYGFLAKKYFLFQETMATHITHEFKSPLASIQSAKLILEEELSHQNPNKEKVKEYFEIIQRNSDRMENFVQNIINLQKAEELPPDSTQKKILFPDFVKDLLGDFINLANRTSVECQVPFEFIGNEEGMKQIFVNLFSNCTKYAPSGPVIIQLTSDTQNVFFSIQD